MLKITKVLALILCITFTSINSQEDKFLSNINLNTEFSPLDTAQFIRGYVQGIEIFQDVFRNSTCIQNGEIMTEDAITLYNILKDLKVDTHIFSNVKDIIYAVQSIISHFKTEEPQCQAALEIAMNDIHKIIDRVERDGYITEFGSHIWNNVSEIEGMIQDGSVNFHNGKMEEAGINFGKATKFVAFWDL